MLRGKRSKYGIRRQQKTPRTPVFEPNEREASGPPLERQEPMATDALVRKARNSTPPD
jgi:hypothetical protein